jgi:hypothetical protein
MSKTRRKSHANGIGDKGHHDWYLRSRILGGARGLRRTVTMRSGLDCTRWAASIGSSSRREPASLRSMTTVVPSIHPDSRRPSQASKLAPPQAGAHSIPMRGNFDADRVLAVDAKTSSTTRRIGNPAASRFIRSPCRLCVVRLQRALSRRSHQYSSFRLRG